MSDTIVENWIKIVFITGEKVQHSIANESAFHDCNAKPYFNSKKLIATLIPTLTLPAVWRETVGRYVLSLVELDVLILPRELFRFYETLSQL